MMRDGSATAGQCNEYAQYPAGRALLWVHLFSFTVINHMPLVSWSILFPFIRFGIHRITKLVLLYWCGHSLFRPHSKTFKPQVVFGNNKLLLQWLPIYTSHFCGEPHNISCHINFSFLRKMDLGLLSGVLGDDSTNISLKSLLFDAELSQRILSQADTKTSIDPFSTQAVPFQRRLPKGLQAQSCIYFKTVFIKTMNHNFLQLRYSAP